MSLGSQGGGRCSSPSTGDGFSVSLKSPTGGSGNGLRSQLQMKTLELLIWAGFESLEIHPLRFKGVTYVGLFWKEESDDFGVVPLPAISPVVDPLQRPVYSTRLELLSTNIYVVQKHPNS